MLKVWGLQTTYQHATPNSMKRQVSWNFPQFLSTICFNKPHIASKLFNGKHIGGNFPHPLPPVTVGPKSPPNPARCNARIARMACPRNPASPGPARRCKPCRRKRKTAGRWRVNLDITTAKLPASPVRRKSEHFVFFGVIGDMAGWS